MRAVFLPKFRRRPKRKGLHGMKSCISPEIDAKTKKRSLHNLETWFREVQSRFNSQLAGIRHFPNLFGGQEIFFWSKVTDLGTKCIKL